MQFQPAALALVRKTWAPQSLCPLQCGFSDSMTLWPTRGLEHIVGIICLHGNLFSHSSLFIQTASDRVGHHIWIHRDQFSPFPAGAGTRALGTRFAWHFLWKDLYHPSLVDIVPETLVSVLYGFIFRSCFLWSTSLLVSLCSNILQIKHCRFPLPPLITKGYQANQTKQFPFLQLCPLPSNPLDFTGKTMVSCTSAGAPHLSSHGAAH